MTSTQKSKKKLVEILWYDAEGDSAWTSTKDLEKVELPLVTCCGYLVKDTPEKVMLAMGYHEDSWVNIFSVPKGMLKGKIKILLTTITPTPTKLSKKNRGQTKKVLSTVSVTSINGDSGNGN